MTSHNQTTSIDGQRHRRRSPSPLAIQRARELIDFLEIDRAEEIEVEFIAATRKAAVMPGQLTSEVARLVRGKKRHLIRIRKELYQTDRSRFYIAHEVGHIILHPTLDQIKSCTEGDMRDYRSDGREAEANRFAAELLMPKKLFSPLCRNDNPSLHDLERLAGKFRTSWMAAGIQFIQYCSEPCALVFSKKRRVQWAARSRDFPFFIERDRRLVSGDGGSYAADLFCGENVPDQPRPVEACNWTDHWEAEDRDVYEHSKAWRDQEGLCVLSLLRDRGS